MANSLNITKRKPKSNFVTYTDVRETIEILYGKRGKKDFTDAAGFGVRHLQFLKTGERTVAKTADIRDRMVDLLKERIARIKIVLPETKSPIEGGDVDRFTRIGTALFGDHMWVTSTYQAVGLQKKDYQRFERGNMLLDREIVAELRRLLTKKLEDLRTLCERVASRDVS